MPPRPRSSDAKLYRKGDGQESRLCYMGHVLMENCNGLAGVAGDVTPATGTAERQTALMTSSTVIGRADGGSRSAATRGSMSKALCRPCVNARVTPHIAIDGHLSKTCENGARRRASTIAPYATSATISAQRCRKRIEEVFGWTKTTGGVAQVKVRGLAKVRVRSPSRSWPTIW